MATKLKNLRISKVDFVDEGANPDAHIKLTKSKGEKGQSTGENGDKNGFVSRLFGFIGKKAGMNQEEIDSAVEEVLKGKEFDPEIYRKCEKYLKEKEGGGRC